MFSGRLTAALASDNSLSVEEAWFEGQGLFEGGDAARRPVPVVDRLPQRASRARVGLRRCAARVPGLLRRADQDRRPAAALAGADRPLLRARRGDRRGQRVPRQRRGRNGIGSTRRCSRTSATTSATSASWRAGRLVLSTTAPTIAATTTSNAAGTTVTQQLHRQRAAPGALDAISSGRPAATRAAQPEAAGRVLPARTRDGTLTYDIAGAGRRTRAATTHRTQNGWYVQGVYQFMPRWRFGVRYDRLDSGTPEIGLVSDGTLRAGRLPDPAAARPIAQHGDGRLVARPNSAACACSRRGTAARSTRDRRPDLPAVHHEPRRARRAQVLGETAMTTSTSGSPSDRCPGAPSRLQAASRRSTSSPASPNGRRSRRSSAATRSRSTSTTTALQDPHHIEARPSLIARMRSADLLVCTGAELEIGWLPVLLQQSGNAEVAAGRAGLLRGRSLRRAARGAGAARPRARAISMPRAIRTSSSTRATSRKVADGAERAAGADRRRRTPRSIRTRVARVLRRAGAEAMRKWEQQARRCRAMPVVAHHKNMTYLWSWLGMREVGDARAEARRPAERRVSRRARSRSWRAQPAKMVVRAAYKDPRASQWLVRAAPACRPSCCRSRSAATTRRRTCSACSTTRIDAAPGGGEMNWSAVDLAHPAAGVRSPACWCSRPTCRSGSRCCARASSSSTSRSRRSPGSASSLAGMFELEPRRLAGAGRGRDRGARLARCCSPGPRSGGPRCRKRRSASLFVLAATGGSCCSRTTRTAASTCGTCSPGRSCGSS